MERLKFFGDFFGKGAARLDKEQGAAKTISLVMAVTLIGKVLGLYRDRLLAIHYDTGMEASAFFTASRIPRVFFDAVLASAIASCFIPVFSEYLAKKGREEALRFAGSFLTLIALLTGGLTLAGMAFPQPLVALFADYAEPETVNLAVSLTRVMFPTVLFSGLAFSLVGVLQAQDHFTAPALMSAVSNLVIIGYFYGLDRRFGIYGLAAAYLLGWFLQGAILLPPLVRMGCRLRPGFQFRSEGVKKVFVLMGPVMVSTWVQPITQAINSRYGSRLYSGAGVAALEYASNLYLVIAGVFILSVTNVIFPKLSRLTAGGETGAFQDTIRQTLRASLFFVGGADGGGPAPHLPDLRGRGVQRVFRPDHRLRPHLDVPGHGGVRGAEHPQPGLLRPSGGERPSAGRGGGHWSQSGAVPGPDLAVPGGGSGRGVGGLLHGVRPAPPAPPGAAGGPDCDPERRRRIGQNGPVRRRDGAVRLGRAPGGLRAAPSR